MMQASLREHGGLEEQGEAGRQHGADDRHNQHLQQALGNQVEARGPHRFEDAEEGDCYSVTT